MIEPWLTKQEIAEHLRCSVRSINYSLNAGMPHAIIYGRAKFRVTEVEQWLAHTGDLQRRGDRVSVDNPDREELHAA